MKKFNHMRYYHHLCNNIAKKFGDSIKYTEGDVDRKIFSLTDKADRSLFDLNIKSLKKTGFPMFRENLCISYIKANRYEDKLIFSKVWCEIRERYKEAGKSGEYNFVFDRWYYRRREEVFSVTSKAVTMINSGIHRFQRMGYYSCYYRWSDIFKNLLRDMNLNLRPDLEWTYDKDMEGQIQWLSCVKGKTKEEFKKYKQEKLDAYGYWWDSQADNPPKDAVSIGTPLDKDLPF